MSQTTSRQAAIRLAAFLYFAAFFGATVSGSTLAPSNSSPRVNRFAVDFNFPTNFVRMVAERTLIDDYFRKTRLVEETPGPGAVRPTPRTKVRDEYVRLVLPDFTEAILGYRTCQRVDIPLPGFRASILTESDTMRPAVFQAALATKGQRDAAALIAERLARDGLLKTLTRVIEALGPARFSTNAAAVIPELWAVGFPVDLLDHFRIDELGARSSEQIPRAIGDKLFKGESVESLEPRLGRAVFRFSKSQPDFEAVAESGQHALGMLRAQVGGEGYDNGIVPGDSLDVAAHLAAILPDVNFLITVPDEYAQNMRWLAQHCWPLTRSNHVTIIAGPSITKAWAQDNGKAGMLGGESDAESLPATLTPRYASQGENGSVFMPAESYLMDGLRAAGHPVIHSPLLFQGGNLMVVHDPATSQRTLLIGEAELYRNVALGLSRDQVLEAFRIEFGVDTSVVMPMASHHLDSAGANLHCFLMDLDMLASAILTENELPHHPGAQEYFRALRAIGLALRNQADLLKKLGWQVTAVPSMPDLYRSINYLNGIHDRTRYVMPAYGGFYTMLDQAAAESFQHALGPLVRIIPVPCATLQRNHGAIHCATSAYPRPPTTRLF